MRLNGHVKCFNLNASLLWPLTGACPKNRGSHTHQPILSRSLQDNIPTPDTLQSSIQINAKGLESRAELSLTRQNWRFAHAKAFVEPFRTDVGTLGVDLDARGSSSDPPGSKLVREYLASLVRDGSDVGARRPQAGRRLARDVSERPPRGPALEAKSRYLTSQNAPTWRENSFLAKDGVQSASRILSST